MTYRAVLSSTPARRLYVADLISTLGDFVGLGALLLFAYRHTGAYLSTGLLFTAQALPALLFGLFGTGVATRLDRSRWLPGLAFFGAAVILLPVAVPTLWMVVVTAMLLGAVRTVSASLRSATVVGDVEFDHRPRLLALMSTSFQTSQVIGYLLGPWFATAVGSTPALVADSVSFALAGMVLTRLPYRPTEVTRPRRNTLSGLRIIWNDGLLRRLAVVSWITLVWTAVPESTAPGLATGAAVGVLMAANPFGAGVGAALFGRLGLFDRPARYLPLTLVAGLGAALTALGATRGSLLLLGGGFVLAGLGSAVVAGCQGTFSQVCSASEMIQVSGTMSATLVVLEGLGAAALGTVADRLGVPVEFWLITGLMLGAGWVTVRRSRVVDAPAISP